MFQRRTYRDNFNKRRFKAFDVQFGETDLWIGPDWNSYRQEMENFSLGKIKELREKLDSYIRQEPAFGHSLIPYQPMAAAPPEAKDMAEAAGIAGVGPMASVAGLFSREAGEALLHNFSVNELVIENGGDIFAWVEHELVLIVFAGNSPLSEKVGVVIPAGFGKAGICTSAGTVGPSLSFGRADAVTVVCKDVLLADAFATAFGNKVKSPKDIEKVLELSENFQEVLSIIIICEDRVGMRGNMEFKILK